MGIPCPIVQYRDWQAGKIAEFDHGVLAKDTRHPYRLQCEQYKLAQWLHGELSRLPGVELLYGHAVTALDQDEDKVTLTLAGPDGTRTLAADWVIGADGGRSTVRKALGIEFPGLTYPERILVIGTTTDFRSIFPEIANVNYVTDPVYYGHILRIPDLWRMSTPVYDEMSDEEAKSDAEIEKRLTALMPGVAFPEIPVKAVYTVHQRVADTYRQGRVFLAGDAAHLNNPKGGMGMNGGLHDALDLTGRLAAVWHGGADEPHARRLRGEAPAGGDRRHPPPDRAQREGAEGNRPGRPRGAVRPLAQDGIRPRGDPRHAARDLDDRLAAPRRDAAVAQPHFLSLCVIARRRAPKQSRNRRGSRRCARDDGSSFRPRPHSPAGCRAGRADWTRKNRQTTIAPRASGMVFTR